MQRLKLNISYDIIFTDLTPGSMKSWLETHPSMKVATLRLDQLRQVHPNTSMTTVQMNHAGYSEQIAP